MNNLKKRKNKQGKCIRFLVRELGGTTLFEKTKSDKNFPLNPKNCFYNVKLL